MNTLEQTYLATVNAQRALLGLPPLNPAARNPRLVTSGAETPSEQSSAAAGPERGSPLWNLLAIQTDDCGDASGYCSECGYETERYDTDDEDWVCAECNAELVRGQERDHAADDPRRGQARDINKFRFEP